MIIDCAIIGGGPAGMNAALVLGRARRKVILFDDDKPRNAVTGHSHGFITRDGVIQASSGRLVSRNFASILRLNYALSELRVSQSQGRLSS